MDRGFGLDWILATQSITYSAPGFPSWRTARPATSSHTPARNPGGRVPLAEASFEAVKDDLGDTHELVDCGVAPPESSLVPVQLSSALEPELESVLDEALGELTDAAQQADGPVAAGLGGRFPFFGMATISAALHDAETSPVRQLQFSTSSSCRSADELS